MADNIIPFPERPQEASAEELDDVNRQMLDLVGFALGIAEFWPEGIEFTPPTAEELEIAKFEASFSIISAELTGENPPPREWQETARARLLELRKASAMQCGYSGHLGILE